MCPSQLPPCSKLFFNGYSNIPPIYIYTLIFKGCFIMLDDMHHIIIYHLWIFMRAFGERTSVWRPLVKGPQYGGLWKCRVYIYVYTYHRYIHTSKHECGIALPMYNDGSTRWSGLHPPRWLSQSTSLATLAQAWSLIDIPTLWSHIAT
jgi:hypothetical protein